MKVKTLLASAMMGCALSVANMAQAAIVLDSWDFDFSGIDGLAAGTTVTNIEEITFNGAAFAQNFGTYGTTDGYLAATSFIDATSGAPIIGSGLNSDPGYEMTFDFSLTSLNLTPPPLSTFTHLNHDDPNALNDGILDVYINNVANWSAGGDCQAGTGTSPDCYTDGVKIASFYVQAGDGGSFNANPEVLDGSDDATFALFEGLTGVLFDEDGNDLVQAALNGELILLAFSDSNFDADPGETGEIGNYQPGVFAGSCDGQSATSFCAAEDGSFRIGKEVTEVPEPSMLALAGIGLLGMGAGALRRRKKA